MSETSKQHLNVQKKQALKQEAQTDGVFPLLCTDKGLTAKQVLKAYKYQPRLEKRFSQFKTVHNAAPLLFKKIERIEANMFGFFIALVIQALIEREVRNKMKENKIETIRVYPEQREADHPTTSKIIDRFENISTYKITENSKIIETFKDSFFWLNFRDINRFSIRFQFKEITNIFQTSFVN